jgi:hypothetical protein
MAEKTRLILSYEGTPYGREIKVLINFCLGFPVDNSG